MRNSGCVIACDKSLAKIRQIAENAHRHALTVDADQLRDVDPTLQSLRNVNTPDDYQQALRKASAEAEGLPPANSQADPARVE